MRRLWGNRSRFFDSKTRKKGHEGFVCRLAAESLSGSVPVAREYEKICPISKAPPLEEQKEQEAMEEKETITTGGLNDLTSYSTRRSTRD